MKAKPLTLERVVELQKQLEVCDKEIDAIIRKYYWLPGAQNTGGNIGELSRMHADLVQLLAEKKRELEKKK